MTIILSERQQATCDAGGWDAFHIEQDCIDLVDRAGETGPVIVLDVEQRFLFALTPAPRKA
jgi:hypothetical protein